MESNAVWKAGESLAWTEHDGPGRPPAAGGRALWLALAAVLGIVFSTLVFADVLCPEHRAWVQALGGVALFGSATTVVALVRGWAAAPVITLVAALNGVAIGVIDAQHEPVRGSLVAAAFVATVAGATVLYLRQLRLARWEREALAPSVAAEAPAGLDAAPAPEPGRPADPVAPHEVITGR